ncbi:acyloxyacyl hydrolase [Brumicola pallidula]|nr:acyloxyacyl hydrolase [Glaciecola pallidula]
MTSVIRLTLITLLYFVCNNAASMGAINGPKRELTVAFGTANLFDGSRYAGYGLEYRDLPVWRKLRPIIGFSNTREHDQYAYIGVRYFFVLNEVWRFNPTFAIGLYNSGNGINLGGRVEFRSGFEFSRQISDRVHLGFGFSHLSNSRIYRSNPGTETLELSLTITL